MKKQMRKTDCKGEKIREKSIFSLIAMCIFSFYSQSFSLADHLTSDTISKAQSYGEHHIGDIKKILKKNTQIPASKWQTLWQGVADSNSSEVTKHDLLRALRQRTSNLFDIQMTWSSGRESYDEFGDSLGTHISNASFARTSDGKILRREYGSNAFGDKEKSQTESYDGFKWRSFFPSSGRNFGAIQDAFNPEKFYELSDPIVLSMALDGKDSLSPNLTPVYSLLSLLDHPNSIVLSDKFILDGVETIVLTDGSTVAYIDPAVGYGVRRLEVWNSSLDKNNNIANYNLVYYRTHTSFEKISSETWFPCEIKQFWLTPEGIVKNKSIVTTKNVEGSKNLSADFFKNIFPYGTVVEDYDAKILFRVGATDQDIEKLISESIVDVKSDPMHHLKNENQQENFDDFFRGSTSVSILESDAKLEDAIQLNYFQWITIISLSAIFGLWFWLRYRKIH